MEPTLSTAKPIHPQSRRIGLASGSPRRRQLLRQLGLEPVVKTADIPEVPQPGERPEQYTLRLATEKGRAVCRQLGGGDWPAWWLAADTVVVHQGAILEKPLDQEDARRLLRNLSEDWHQVLTAFWLGQGSAGPWHAEVVHTRVRFRKLSEQEIDRYIASGEPMDKAGAYGIQGLAASFVRGIEGCYFNVVGLPLERVVAALYKMNALEGFPFPPTPQEAP